MNTGKTKLDKDVLTTGQRVGEWISIVFMVGCLGFFLYHQTARTGFFTSQFGAAEMLCFYGPMLLAISAPLVRGVTGRRNPARLLEVITNLCQALGASWLLVVFPFNFLHLADALPVALRFLLSWVSNDLGKLVLLLQIGVCPLMALVTLWIYLSRRQRANSPPLSPQPS